MLKKTEVDIGAKETNSSRRSIERICHHLPLTLPLPINKDNKG